MKLGFIYSKKLDGISLRDPPYYGFLGYVYIIFAGDLEDKKLVMRH